MVCSVYQTQRPVSNLDHRPKNRVHFSDLGCDNVKMIATRAPTMVDHQLF
jgi:hypothetical protein